MKLKVFFTLALVALTTAQEFQYEEMNFKIPDNVEEFIRKADDYHASNRNSRILNGRDVTSNLEWPFVVELTITMGARM